MKRFLGWLMCKLDYHDDFELGFNSPLNPCPVRQCKRCGRGAQFNIVACCEMTWTAKQMKDATATIERANQMNPELQQRIAAIKAECEEILRLSEKATPGPWRFVDSPSNQTVQGSTRPVCALATLSSRDDDFRFIAHARNVSPAMARVVMMTIDDGVAQGDDIFLEIIANRWEGKP